MPPRHPEENRRRPRVFRHSESSDGEGEDLVNDNEDIDEEEEDEDSDELDEEIEIPPDPAHEARMAVLRAENAQRLLRQRVEEEENMLSREIELRNQIFEDLQRMEARHQELLAQRELSLQELAALESDSSDDEESDQCEAQEAAENQPKQKDDNPDPGNDSTSSTSQPSN